MMRKFNPIDDWQPHEDPRRTAYVARLERQLANSQRELQQERKVTQDLQKNLHNEMLGNMEIRKRYGAKENETMFTFIERLASEATSKTEVSKNCIFCDSSNNLVYRFKRPIGWACKECDIAIPDKVSRHHFDSLFWKDAGEEVDENIKNEFYVDYLSSELDLEQYEKNVTIEGEEVLPENIVNPDPNFDNLATSVVNEILATNQAILNNFNKIQNPEQKEKIFSLARLAARAMISQNLPLLCHSSDESEIKNKIFNWCEVVFFNALDCFLSDETNLS